MIKLRDIALFFAETLDQNQEFKDLSIATIDGKFNYFVNVDLENTEVPMPYFSIVAFEKKYDKEVEKAYEVILLVGIARTEPTKSGNITEEISFSNLETLSIEAVETIEKEMRLYGISGEKNLYFTYANYFFPNPSGEDDYQCQISIEIQSDLFLGC